MNFLNEWIPESLTYALGWTLLHSLWQGAIAALLVALLLLMLHRSSSTIRYFVTTTALFTVLCVTVVTFLVLYLPAREAEGALSSSPSIAAAHQGAGLTAQTQARHLPLTLAQTVWGFGQYFNQHLPAIVTVWLMGIVLLALRLLGGLAYLQRLRNYQVSPVAPEWQQRCQAIRYRIQVSPAVQLAESALVKIPVVIGYFKPLVLLPLGAINGLPAAQVEAILAHELAHIRRNDYLINLFQSLVEILFFYHPAIWWISGCIREEREHCCDDVALSVCNDSLTYAKALANLEAIPYYTPQLAMGLMGRSGRLLYRIERLMKHPQRTPSFPEGMIAALVLVAGFLAISESATAGFRLGKIRANVESALSFDKTPSFSQELPVDTLRQRNEVTIVKDKKGRIVELYINGRKIPKNQIDDYKDFIEGRTQELPALAAVPALSATPVPAPSPYLATPAAPALALTPSMNFGIVSPGLAPFMAATAPVAPIASVHGVEAEREALRIEQQMERVHQQMEEIRERMDREMEKVEEQREEGLRRLEEQIQTHEQTLERLHQQQEALHEREAELAERHEAEMHQQEIAAHKDEKVYLAVAKELKKDGLIEDEKNYEFRLDRTGFYLKGKKQPDAVYKKYKQLMEKEFGKPFKDTDSIHIQYSDN